MCAGLPSVQVPLSVCVCVQAYLVYKYRGKEHTSHGGGGTTMLSRGSKYTMTGTKPQSSLSNAVSTNGGFGDKGEEEECESFLEKDIQVVVVRAHYIHTCQHVSVHAFWHACMCSYIGANMTACIHLYIHTCERCMYAYVRVVSVCKQTYIHAHSQTGRHI